MALTSKHAQLLKSHRALLLTFESFPIAGKLSAVALALLLGIYGSINALKGTASDTVQVCIRNNKQALQCADKAGKPYIMTEYHAQQWKANGVPGEVVFATQHLQPIHIKHCGCYFLLAVLVLQVLA
jgi:hypothetical protein